ncbi:hypothetical protein ACOSQ2_001955 [Xanthoceras sorbifolium]
MQGDRNYKITVDMPDFKGTQNMEEFFLWVDEMESRFRVMDCSEERKLKVVTNKLKGSAAAYWKRVATNSQQQQQSNLYARPMPSIYYHCHLPGHRSNQCPQRPSANFIEAEYAEEDEEDLEPAIVEGIEDDRDLFVGMVQRARVAEIVKGNEEDEYWWPGC